MRNNDDGPGGKDDRLELPEAGSLKAGLPRGCVKLRKLLRRHRALISDLALAGLAAVAAGVSGIIGLTHLPWLELTFLSATSAVIAFAISQAILSRKAANTARRWWLISTMTILALSACAYMYHKFLDPATHRPQTYQFVVNGTEGNYIPLYGEAGGPKQLLATGDAAQKALIGGQDYNFYCWTIGRDGHRWLRYQRFGQTWWAPQALLHPPFGERQASLPHC